MTCIYGQLEIYGHIIKQGQPPQDVFSVYTHSYLTINGVPYSEPEKSKKGIRREIRALLKPYMKLGNWLTLPDDSKRELVMFWMLCSKSSQGHRKFLKLKPVGSRLGSCVSTQT